MARRNDHSFARGAATGGTVNTGLKMKKNQIIQLEPKERILAKARNYVESIESFLEESDGAIPLLLRALMPAR